VQEGWGWELKVKRMMMDVKEDVTFRDEGGMESGEG
jgi:hypothetical protein